MEENAAKVNLWRANLSYS